MYNQETLDENVFVVTPKLFHYYINHSCEPIAIDILVVPIRHNPLRCVIFARMRKSPLITMRRQLLKFMPVNHHVAGGPPRVIKK